MKDLKDMTPEELAAIEDASVQSARNMGAPKDLFHQDYGWILIDGKPTEAYKEFYEKELMNLKFPKPELVTSEHIEVKENDMEEPYEDDKDRWESLTVGMLIKMLKKLPSDYEVKYDGFCGSINKGDLKINHTNKEISING
jgi:hypothetical protein